MSRGVRTIDRFVFILLFWIPLHFEWIFLSLCINNNFACLTVDSYITLDKRGSLVLISFKENVCCGYSLEAPHRGASNEYHNIFFVEQ